MDKETKKYLDDKLESMFDVIMSRLEDIAFTLCVDEIIGEENMQLPIIERMFENEQN